MGVGTGVCVGFGVGIGVGEGVTVGDVVYAAIILVELPSVTTVETFQSNCISLLDLVI